MDILELNSAKPSIKLQSSFFEETSPQSAIKECPGTKDLTKDVKKCGKITKVIKRKNSKEQPTEVVAESRKTDETEKSKHEKQQVRRVNKQLKSLKDEPVSFTQEQMKQKVEPEGIHETKGEPYKSKTIVDKTKRFEAQQSLEQLQDVFKSAQKDVTEKKFKQQENKVEEIQPSAKSKQLVIQKSMKPKKIDNIEIELMIEPFEKVLKNGILSEMQ